MEGRNSQIRFPCDHGHDYRAKVSSPLLPESVSVSRSESESSVSSSMSRPSGNRVVERVGATEQVVWLPLPVSAWGQKKWALQTICQSWNPVYQPNCWSPVLRVQRASQASIGRNSGHRRKSIQKNRKSSTGSSSSSSTIQRSLSILPVTLLTPRIDLVGGHGRYIVHALHRLVWLIVLVPSSILTSMGRLITNQGWLMIWAMVILRQRPCLSIPLIKWHWKNRTEYLVTHMVRIDNKDPW